jgi:hypothetical protein
MAEDLGKNLADTKRKNEELFDAVIMFKKLVRYLIRTTGKDHDTCFRTALGRVERAESKNKQKKS